MSPSRNQSSLRSTLIYAIGGIAVSSVYVLGHFVFPGFRKICLPYVPATQKQLTFVAELLKLAEARAHRRLGNLLDVGSGDGRVVLSLLADKQLKSLTSGSGVELNRPLVWWSRLAAWWQGDKDRASFHCCNLWTFDFSPFQTVFVFGVSDMMKPLEKKLLSEMRGDPVIVVCRFPLPTLPYHVKSGSGPDTVYLYLPRFN